MARNLIESEATGDRVEIVCDGCGRVFHTLHPEDAEEFEPDDFAKIGGMEYCQDCEENHAKRFLAQQNTFENQHLKLRETIADSDELEEALADLERSRSSKQGVVASPTEEREDSK